MLAYAIAARFGILFQQILRSYQHPRRAVAALQRIAIAKGRLQIGNFSAVGETLDGLDSRTIGLHREHQAGANDLAVHAYRAGTADAVFAADMCSGQMQVLAQEIRKIKPRQDMRIDSLAVDIKRDRQGSRHAALPFELNSGRPNNAETQRVSNKPAKCPRIAAVAC